MQWMMLQQDAPHDFVIATGKQYSIRKFVEMTARKLNMKLSWKGKGIKEFENDPVWHARKLSLKDIELGNKRL